MPACCASRSARRGCRYSSPSRWRCSYCLRCFWLSARRWRFTFPTPYPACRWVPGDLPSGSAKPFSAAAPGSTVSFRCGGKREITGRADAASRWRPCGNLAFGGALGLPRPPSCKAWRLASLGKAVGMFRNLLGDDRAAISVASALSLVAVIGIASLSVEFGHALLQRSDNQRVADLAAHGG